MEGTAQVTAGGNLRSYRAWPQVISIVIAFAFTSVAAAGQPDAADGSATSASQDTDSWFDIDRLDLNVYGLSYHPDREAVHKKDLDNQVNWGLGLHYSV